MHSCRPRRARRLAHCREDALRPERSRRMAFRDTWHRTLVYFGLAEDRDAYEEDEVEYREP